MSSNGASRQPGTCPLCDSRLYGWVALPPRSATVGVGVPLAESEHDRILDRCERCGVAVERGREVDLVEEWEAVCRPADGGARSIAIPNRASLQAWVGEGGWAAIDAFPGRLIHSPDSLERLAARNDHSLERRRTPVRRRPQGWMWQTMLNGLTFHRNFAREVRARRLRFEAGGRLRFAVDVVVTVLGAPLVLLVSAPLELGAALARRGGELVAIARRSTGASPPA